MDPQTRLILIHSNKEPPRWEDEEKACYDVVYLREEFRKRLIRLQVNDDM